MHQSFALRAIPDTTYLPATRRHFVTKKCAPTNSLKYTLSHVQSEFPSENVYAGAIKGALHSYNSLKMAALTVIPEVTTNFIISNALYMFIFVNSLLKTNATL